MDAASDVDSTPGLRTQLARFIAVGVVAALVDFGIYSLLLEIGVWVHAAKGVSFIVGTTTAYLLNRRFTFTADGGSGRFAAFCGLYAATFALNIGVNAVALHLLPDWSLRTASAWVLAQGVATVTNFVLLRTVVFRLSGPCIGFRRG